MAWVGPAIAVGGSLLGSMMSGSDSKAGGTPSYTMQTMPPWLQEKMQASMQAMPNNVNVSFGGQTYPLGYGPLVRAASKLYAPTGTIPYQNDPSALSGAMTAAAPWMWMYANQGGQNKTPTPAFSPGSWASMAGSDYAAGPGWGT